MTRDDHKRQRRHVITMDAELARQLVDFVRAADDISDRPVPKIAVMRVAIREYLDNHSPREWEYWDGETLPVQREEP